MSLCGDLASNFNSDPQVTSPNTDLLTLQYKIYPYHNSPYYLAFLQGVTVPDPQVTSPYTDIVHVAVQNIFMS